MTPVLGHLHPCRILAVAAALLCALAPAVPVAAPPPAVRERVIIDTDVGDDIDDAFALVSALSDPGLEVVGITTAWGDTHTRTLLVRRLLAALGRADVPVAEGPPTPNKVPFTQRRWALGAGDGGPAPDAVEFLRSRTAAEPGRLTLLALAPLSNVAALAAREPAALGRFRQVVMMGGSIRRGYNTGGAIPNPTPHAEYNVASAPAALTTLLASGVPVRMFPLDSTQLKYDEVRRDRLFAHGSPASDALALLYHQWRLLNGWGQLTPTLFDVVPVVWLGQPSLCQLEKIRIAVDAEGYTRPVPGAPNAEVCLTLDEGAAMSAIDATLEPER
jgi:inosine-uridine nucleoside N-ribohydrolase